MDVRTEFYNTNKDTTKDYLSAGLTKLPALYFFFSRIYLCFLGFWVFVCLKNHQSFHWIHLLIGVLVVMKGLNLFCAAEVQHFVKVTGTHPHRWDVLFHIFQFFRVVLLYTLIAVTHTKTTKTLMIVIPIQVLATVVSVRMETIPLDDDLFYWDLVVTLLNSICIWNTPMFETDETDQEARNSLTKFTIFRQFHKVAGSYLVVDIILGIIVTYSYQWESNAANEIASLVFYMVMSYMFRPFEKNEYILQLDL
ncbi:hypothetical protein L1887_36143 [Cichorium endivia]|nr:hypothetical protein L1887_36143 [Cichorium endivia]